MRETINDLWLIGDSLDLVSEEEVVWMDTEYRGLPLIAAGPLNIGTELNQLLYPGLKSLILVSATLSVGKSFEYVKNRLGLDCLESERIREWLSPSPFDFEKNCRTLAVNNITEPGNQKFAESIAQCIKTIAHTVEKKDPMCYYGQKPLAPYLPPLKGERRWLIGTSHMSVPRWRLWYASSQNGRQTGWHTFRF